MDEMNQNSVLNQNEILNETEVIPVDVGKI
jgi:hypothetical protein